MRYINNKNVLRSMTIALALMSAEWMPAADGPVSASVTAATAQSLVPQKVTATGRVMPLASARVGPRVAGILAAFAADETGRPVDVGSEVKKGQKLFWLDPNPLTNVADSAAAAVKVAEAQLANLKSPPREERVTQLKEAIGEIESRLVDKARDEERYRRLVEDEKTMPQRRLEEIQTEVRVLRALKRAAEARLREAENGPTVTELAVAEAQLQQARAQLKSAQDDLRDATVSAPFDGVITRRTRSVGDFVPAGPEDGVVELVGNQSMEIDLRLPESYFTSVRAGSTRVIIHSPLLKEPLTATVSRVVGAIDSGRGTFGVRVIVENTRLAPGAFVSAELNLEDDGRGVVIPQRAVRRDEKGDYVFVADKGRMTRRAVELGDKLTENVVVTAGLSAGQTVLLGAGEQMVEGAAVPGDMKVQ